MKLISKKIITILIFISTVTFSQESNNIFSDLTFQTKGGKWVYNPPYYALYGYQVRKDDLEIYAPFIGIGLLPTKFSSAFVAQVGLMLHYHNFSWKLDYLQTIIPDMSLFDYKNLEYIGQSQFIWDFSHFRISSLTQVGLRLFAYHSKTEAELEKNAFTTPSIKQIFSLDSQIFNNDFIIMTSMINTGIEYVPHFDQTSYFIKTVNPITLDFIHSKIGFMASMFYTTYLSKNTSLIIGENYSGYDEAIGIITKNIDGLFNNFYHLTGTLDFIYRIYFRSLPTPANRIYIAIGGNIGFGYHQYSQKTDLLYIGTMALGFEYKDTVPFEFRFSLDQDGNFFFNMSVVSPISHRFDSNLD